MDERLDMRLKAQAVETANRYAPWRAGIAWWVVGIQGAVVLVLGLWLIFNQSASDVTVAGIGLVMLLVSAAWAWSAMRSELPQVVLGWRGLRGGVGLTVGLLVVLDFFIDLMPLQVVLGVLSVGLLMVGTIGIIEWLVGREVMGWQWPALLGPAIAIVFGLIVLASRLQTGALFLQIIAVAAIAVGIILLVRAGLLFRQDQLARTAGSGSVTAASTPPTPVSQGPAGGGSAVTARSTVSTRTPEPPAPPSEPPAS